MENSKALQYKSVRVVSEMDTCNSDPGDPPDPVRSMLYSNSAMLRKHHLSLVSSDYHERYCHI